MSRILNDLKNKRAGLLENAEKALTGNDEAAYTAAMDEVKKLNAEITNHEALDAEKGRFSAGDKLEAVAEQQKAQAEDDELTIKVDAARSGNEYIRAFAYAIKNGINPQNVGMFGSAAEKVAPLTNALKQAGGTPVGSDGGFLVPVDIDNQIREFRRELKPLADLVTEESVTAPTGWRVHDEHPTAGFTKLDGELSAIPSDDQPKFAQVAYKVDAYGLFIPISNELLDDEIANLMNYLVRWFGKKGVITENKIILKYLAELAATTIPAGEEIDKIKTALNVTLDPALTLSAKILTNQDGFDALDHVKDDHGNPLLQPSPTDETLHRVKGRDVVVVSNSILPSVEGAEPVYVGDFKEYMTLFKRKALEVESTRIGGDSWRKNGTEVRGIMRLDASKFDTAAALKLALTPGA